MVRSRAANPNPEMLRWARLASGLSLEDAAKKIGVSSQRLAEFESGDRLPTIKQLRTAAEKYKRSLATFYLSETPPVPSDPVRDFRTVTGEPPAERSYALELEVRRAMRRREIAREVGFPQALESPKFPRALLTDDPEESGSILRDWIDSGELPRFARADKPLKRWISTLEHKGVLVFQSTGAHTADIDEYRGFSIAEFPLPVIVLNGRDTYNGRVFTLLHEMAHLLLRGSGMCQPIKVNQNARDRAGRTEVYCNHVAGATLMPLDRISRESVVLQANNEPLDWSDVELQALARRYGVSREAVLRRLLILGVATEDYYREKRAQFLEEYRDRKETERQRNAEKDIRIPMANLVATRNGYAYSRLILEALDDERITYSAATDYLGVRPKHLNGLNAIVRDEALAT